LGEGELKTSLIFKVALYSESAKKKIEASGGKIESVKPAASEVKV
jgi:ribosomal protein L15